MANGNNGALLIIRNNNDIGDVKNSITNHKNEQQRQTQ